MPNTPDADNRCGACDSRFENNRKFQTLENSARELSNHWNKPAWIFFRSLAVFIASLSAIDAHALGPHEIALLVNGGSPASREIANTWAKLRGVPPENIITLDLPADFGGANSTITPDEFTQRIWTPATNAIAKRGIADHLIAWVYSAGFPTAISYDPPVSIHGMTFVRGRLPSRDDVNKATFSSPLFRGPGVANGPQGKSVSLEQFAANLGTNYPLPAMTLGHVAPRGLPVADILEALKFSIRADCLRPEGAVNFVMSDDVRSTCRAWEVPGTVEELERLGVKTLVTSNVPDTRMPLIGLQAGSARIEGFLEAKLQAGSMAEHLTSFGAAFGTDDQSKITLWQKAGAAGTAGTVSEPFALWPKFPHARFFAHYAGGCTMLESFYESIASPMQIFLLGDPLARPYGHTRELSLLCLSGHEDAIIGSAEFAATDNSGAKPYDLVFIFFLDGATLPGDGTSAGFKIDTKQLDDGWHELRVIGYTKSDVREQSFAVERFGVNNHGRGVKIKSPVASRIESSSAVEFKLEAAGGPASFEIMAQDRVIATATNATLSVDLGKAGPGPVRIQAIAKFADGGIVRSRPQWIEIKPPAQ